MQQKDGADAIHPGYGFLSENSIFARKVIRNNIIWIGPTPHVIKVMGDKIKAKELAIKANVPTLEKAENIKDSKQLGFPLLIKAAAGGGGKGMRVVNNKNELKDAVAAAKEAKAGFDDERVLLRNTLKNQDILRFRFWVINMEMLYILVKENAQFKDDIKKLLKSPLHLNLMMS